MEESSLSPSHTSASPDAVKQLRTLVHAVAISLLILTGTLFVFLYRQVISLRKNTKDLANYVVEYDRSNAPEFIADVHRRFAEFRKQHPDFTPVYARYFGTNEPPAAASAPASGATNQSKVLPAPTR